MRCDAIEWRWVCSLQKESSNASDDGDDTSVNLPDRRLGTEESFIIAGLDQLDPIRSSIPGAGDHFSKSVRQRSDDRKMTQIAHEAESRTK